MAGPYATSDPRNYVGIGKQTVKGTGVAPALFAAYLPSVDLEHGQEVNPLKEGGTAGEVTISEKMAHMPGGQFTFLARPSISAKVSAYLLGVDTLTGAGPYTHVLTGDLVADLLSVEQNLADEGIERFVDCAISEVVYTVSTQDTQIVRVQASWIGGTPMWQGAATTETYEAESPFTFSNGAFTIDGTVVTNIRRLSVTVRTLWARERVNDVVPSYLVKLGFEVEVEIEQLMLDVSTDGYRRTHYGSNTGTTHSKNPSTGSVDADFNYGAGAGARRMRWEVPNIDYTNAKYSSLNPDGEAVILTRNGVGKKVGASPLFRYTGTTNDSVAYV